MNRRILFSLATVLLLLAIVFPIPTSIPHLSADESGGISGIVTETDGMTPIAGALVAFFDYAGSPYVAVAQAYTRGDGSYSASLSAGRYRVQASSAGYVTEYYADRLDSAFAWPVMVVSGVTTPNIQLTLDKYGAISGRAYHTDGITPIANARVTVHRDGSASYCFLRTGTDGTYGVQVVPGKLHRERVVRGKYNEYYEQQIRDTGANLLRVDSEQYVMGIDFTLDKFVGDVR
ncbi:MAG: carboxypeptidase regulatory-like domain-containing protein [Chloroflexi bacterium]|nr:carboxypeptidase regulatory-like domain-containing protein [Chloroflexota bacterium]